MRSNNRTPRSCLGLAARRASIITDRLRFNLDQGQDAHLRALPRSNGRVPPVSNARHANQCRRGALTCVLLAYAAGCSDVLEFTEAIDATQSADVSPATNGPICGLMNCTSGASGGVATFQSDRPMESTSQPACTIISPIGLSDAVLSEADTSLTLFIDLAVAGFDPLKVDRIVWDFGVDESMEGDVVVQHVYPAAGVYELHVTVETETRSGEFTGALTIETDRVSLTGGPCPNERSCTRLDCANRRLSDPCDSDEPPAACPARS